MLFAKFDGNFLTTFRVIIRKIFGYFLWTRCRIIRLYEVRPRKKFDDIFSSVDKVGLHCVTEGRTDRHRTTASILRYV